MLLWAALLLVATPSVLGFRSPYPKSQTRHFDGDAGPRLHVTPYLQRGDISQARELSLVTGLTPNITSYSGFITVDEECDSNLFFWFFPSQSDWSKDPVSLWLNGGPGSTSMFGLLTENGPYELSLDGKLGLREYSWNRNSSVIYIDNPVGTGYSYTSSLDCYNTQESQVGRNLRVGLEQFFQLFPEISKSPFYLTGESYAGKYIPAVAYAILDTESPVNLQGLAIGNGLTDPINQLNYADYLHQLGLIDEDTRQELKTQKDLIIDYIKDEQYELANLFNNAMLGAVTENAGINALYNYLFEYGEPEADVDTFMSSAETRRAIHVGNATWNDGSDVYVKLFDDIMKSVKDLVEVLVEKYRVLLYNGQLDIICGYPMSVDYIRQLNWTGSEEYLHAKRKIWMVEDRVAGYSKTVGNFTEVLVRNAGHMVPTDQPAWALDLYNKFIFNQPY